MALIDRLFEYHMTAQEHGDSEMCELLREAIEACKERDALHDDYAELLSAAHGVLIFPDDSPEFNAHWDIMRRHVNEALNLGLNA